MNQIATGAALLLILLMMTGCAATPEDAAGIVQRHLTARVESNAETLRGLTCAAQESQVEMLARSLQGLNATLKDVACTFDGSSSVTCTGSIVVDYQGELRELPLSRYSVVQEDGQWKWCGEAE